MIAQAFVREAGFVVVLYPFQPARCHVGRRTQTGTVRQNFKGQIRGFEGDRTAALAHPDDSKDLAADLVDIRIAPLHHMRGLGQGGTEVVQLITGHMAQSKGLERMRKWAMMYA